MGKKRDNNPVVEVFQSSMEVVSFYSMTPEETKKLSELKASIIEEANEHYPTNRRSKLFETVETLSMTKEQQVLYYSYRKPKPKNFVKPSRHKITLMMKIYEEELR